MLIASDAKLVRDGSLPYTELEDAIVFLHVDSGDYLRLTGSARAIWERLGTPSTVSELVASLVAEYGIDPIQCEKDTMPFLEELLGEGILKQVQGES